MTTITCATPGASHAHPPVIEPPTSLVHSTVRRWLATAAGLALASSSAPGVTPASAQSASPLPAPPSSCLTSGELQFVCGLDRPEDIAAIPGTPWVVASSMSGSGLRLIDSGTRRTIKLFPVPGLPDRFDRRSYPDCPGPLSQEEKDKFLSHGVALRATKGGHFDLFVVHHGERESIEVFDIDAAGERAPGAIWKGCAVAPGKLMLNAVAPLPGGGFVTTNFMDLAGGMEAGMARVTAGEPAGEPWQWTTAQGWRKLDIGKVSGPNGIEVSRDGHWLFVALWGNKALLRQSLGDDTSPSAQVQLDFHLDNIRMGPDGMLYGAGQGEHSSHAVRIDPQRLVVKRLLDRKDDAAFGHVTTAIPVGSELWLGAFQGDRIAILPAPGQVGSPPN